MIQGEGQAVGVGHLPGLGERLAHGLQGAVRVAQVPEDVRREAPGEHPGFLPGGERERAVPLRIVEGDRLLEVGQRGRELSQPQQGVPHRPVRLDEVGRGLSPSGHVEELLGHLVRGP